MQIGGGQVRRWMDQAAEVIPRWSRSRFARDAALLTGVTAIERAGALVQTVLIARALGIVEYGIYGLLFTTIGFVSSVVGLQMGLTATVLVARYRDDEKAKAAAVISHVTQFALIVAVAFCLLVMPFSSALSSWLLRSPDHASAIVLGCLFVGASLMSGVQDGVAQGFEDFRSVAMTRFLCAVLTVAAVYPAGSLFGLDGVVVAIFGGVLLKILILQRVIHRHRREAAIPRRGEGVGFASMVVGFSLPSMLASLLLGGMTWWGSFLLSRQAAGFAGVALVNTGLQWRGPVLMLAASLGSVAVPVFSRLSGRDDRQASALFKQRMLLANAGAAILASLAIILLSHPLLEMYGSGFSDGGMIFGILVATTVPMVVANVYMQELVGAGLLWRQLALHVPMVALMGVGFLLLIPHMGGLGYAIAVAAASLLFLGCAMWFGPSRARPRLRR